MSAGTTNNETFANAYILYPTSTANTFTIGLPEKHDTLITDTPDNASDDTTVLGDISNDGFTKSTDGGTSYQRTYVGETANGTGIVGSFATKKGTGYSLYTNYSYTYGSTVTVKNGEFALLCFASGTAIRTVRGEVAVEDLKVGDVAVTATRMLRPIRWIGRRRVDAAGAILPFERQPVCVRAGAFGAHLPRRDLLLSPGHPVLVGADANNEGGCLVPVMCLINGTTVKRIECCDITYWHIELDAHDLLLAEGLPAESYFELGGRAFFEGSDDVFFDPDFLGVGAKRCRRVETIGPMVDAARATLDTIFAAQLNRDCDWPIGGEMDFENDMMLGHVPPA